MIQGKDPALADLRKTTRPQRQIIRREGEYWTIIYAGETCRLKDTNGLRFLAYQLHNPHEPVSCLEMDRASAGIESPGGPTVNGHADHAARERARVNVTRALLGALKRIGEHHPELARHLEATLRTGAFCVYRPDPRVPVGWTR